MRWREVAGGFYEVSDTGLVRRKKPSSRPGMSRPGRLCKRHPDNDGYWVVYFSCDGVFTKHFVHKLVAEAFLGPCPPGKEVNHKDTNKANPHWKNLEYLTKSQNALHAVAHGLWPMHNLPVKRGSDHGMSKLTENDVRRIRRIGHRLAQNEIGRRFGVCGATIGQVLDSKTWRHV
jgi:hypothetical protein